VARMRSSISCGLVGSLITGIILSTSGWLQISPAHAQQKPKRKDFGSSLKRIRWDPVKQSGVEIKDSPKGDSAASDLDVVRVQTDLVVLAVQVRDRQGRVITGLTRDDFIVTDEGRPQTIEHFSVGSDLTVPRSIILIIDYSGSLREYLNQSIDAAEVLIGKLGPKDRMAVVTDDVKLLVDFTADPKQLTKALESLRSKAKERKFGRSFQMTALMAAVRELFDEEDVRPIVIFQTDGDEVGLLQPPDPRFYFLPELPANASPELKKFFASKGDQMRKKAEAEYKSYSLKDVYNAVEKSRATVYTIIPGEQLVGLSADQQYSRVRKSLEGTIYFPPQSLFAFGAFSDEQVRQITECYVRAQTAAAGAAITSGGWTAFLNRPEQAADIYSTILADINSRYVIGYYPLNKVHDGRRRMVSVDIRGHADYILSGRRSYYAPEPEP
jgi:VWFA-related protein